MESISMPRGAMDSHHVDPEGYHSLYRLGFPIERIETSVADFENCVGNFADWDFTFERDALDAFQGVLDVFESPPIENFFGLPLYPADSRFTSTDTFVYGLSWSFRKNIQTRLVRRPEFPTWAWLGWKPDKSTLKLSAVDHDDGDVGYKDHAYEG